MMPKPYSAAIAVLTILLLVSPLLLVMPIARAESGGYVVTESGSGTLSLVTPDGARTAIYSSTTGFPWGVAVDSSGNYVLGEGFYALSMVTPAGLRTVIYNYTDQVYLDVAIDSSGSYIVAEQYWGNLSNVLSRITPAGVRTVIGNLAASTWPSVLAIDPSGNYIVSEYNVLSKVTPARAKTVIYSFPYSDSLGGVAVDSSGNYIVTEMGMGLLSKVTPAGVRTVIYNFSAGAKPAGLAIDPSGNYIIAEWGSDVLSKVTPAGTRTVIYSFPKNTEPVDVAMVQQAPPTTNATITIGTTDTVQTTLDPADAYDYFGINIIENVGDGLVDYVPGTTTLAPALATSWTTSTDGLTWTFDLRQGVTFPDGTPFNASVVKYSVDRQFTIAESGGPFEGVGYDGYTGGFINKTVVTGPYQIQFVLNRPFSPFLATVAFIPLYPVNPNVAHMTSIVQYTDGNAAASNPTGLGPYLLSKWVRSAGKDVEIDLTANPNYWNASANWPATKNIVIKFFSDSTALALALQNGDIDVAYRQFDASTINSFSTNSNFRVWTGPGTFIQYLVFNTKASPFDNVLVREALAAAINRSSITQGVFQGQAQPLYSMIPNGMFSHTDAFKTQFGEANTSMAQQLLTQAGYSTTNKLTFTLTYPTGHYTSMDAVAAALKQAMEATGMVSVNLASQPWTTYTASTASNALQVYIYGWYPDYADPYDYTFPFLPPDGVGFLHTQFVDATINSLLAQVVQSTDISQQQSLYGQLQTRLAQTAPMVPLFQGVSFAVSTPKIDGIVLDTTSIFRYFLLYPSGTSIPEFPGFALWLTLAASVAVVMVLSLRLQSSKIKALRP